VRVDERQFAGLALREAPIMNDPVLLGRHVRLEPLHPAHVPGLVRAAAGDRTLYQWSPVPSTAVDATRYVQTAEEWRTAGTAVPFAVVRPETNEVVGSTRFWNIERWPWPDGHGRYGREPPDVCEIGYTWLSMSAIRSAVNTEAKLLMLTHAFETWGVLRVCFHTDVRNDRSRAALERLGASNEGLLRAHRLAADFTPRDSMRYSIVAAEWPSVRARLARLLETRG
jgi:N-acetyltransferase